MAAVGVADLLGRRRTAYRPNADRTVCVRSRASTRQALGPPRRLIDAESRRRSWRGYLAELTLPQVEAVARAYGEPSDVAVGCGRAQRLAERRRSPIPRFSTSFGFDFIAGDASPRPGPIRNGVVLDEGSAARRLFGDAPAIGALR